MTNRGTLQRRVYVAGGTGLVGGLALAHLLASPEVNEVVAVGRRAPPVQSPKLRARIVDFAHPELWHPVEAPDRQASETVAICALGTTIARAGSREAFRAIDFTGVLAFGRYALECGSTALAHVSSVGANPGSTNFYLHVKGEAEAALESLGFARTVALRPGVLLGQREQSRPGEAVAQVVMSWLNPLLVGPLRMYRGIAADEVARALVTATEGEPGRFVWTHPMATGTRGPSGLVVRR